MTKTVRRFLLAVGLCVGPVVARAGYLVNENFDASDFPAGWVSNSLVRTASGGAGGSGCWYINANGDYLITPLLTTPGWIKFDYRGTSGSLQVFRNNVQSTNNRSLLSNQTGNGSYYEVHIDLSAFTNIYLVFMRQPSLGNHYIDNVRVTNRDAPPPGEAVSLTDLAVSNTLLLPSLGDVPVMALRVVSSSNGRTLTGFAVSNAGTLEAESVASVRLVHDTDGDRTWGGGDTVVAELRYDGTSRWTNGGIVSSLALDPPGGQEFLVLVDMAATVTSYRTLRMVVPVGGIRVSSGVTNGTALAGSRTFVTPTAPKAPLAPIKISQFASRGVASGEDELIELFNPLFVDVSIAGWKIQYFGGSGWSTKATIALTNTHIIPARGYYYIGTNGSQVMPDLRRSFSMADGAAGSPRGIRVVDASNTVVDTVMYEGAGNTANALAEGGFTAPAPNLTAAVYNRSLLRKASAMSTVASMTAGGAEEHAGNGYDSDHNYNDFVLLPVRRPRNATPEDVGFKDGSVPPDISVGPGTENVVVMSFVYTNRRGIPLRRLAVRNTGTVEPSAVKVYRDEVPLGQLDGGDGLVGTMVSVGGGVYTNGGMALASGTACLVVVDIPGTALGGETVKLRIPRQMNASATGVTNRGEYTNGAVLRVVVDTLSFHGRGVSDRTVQVGEAMPVLAFSVRSSETGMRLASMELTNVGVLEDSRVASVTLFRKVGVDLTEREAGDVAVGRFVQAAPRRWSLQGFGSVDISWDNAGSNYLAVLRTTTEFTGWASVGFGIAADRIVSSGSGKAPGALYTDGAVLKVTNGRPEAPAGFACAETNAGSARFRWDAYAVAGDFGRFVLEHWTNGSAVTNRVYVTDRAATNHLLTGLGSYRLWHVRLRVEDQAGQRSTNTGHVSVRTRKDLNPPAFDAASLKVDRVNGNVIHISWRRAQDAEGGDPVTYLVYVRRSGASWVTNEPQFTTQATNFSFSRETGVWEVTVRAQDVRSNRTAFDWSAVRSVEVRNLTENLDRIYFYPNPLRKGEEVRFNSIPDDAEILVYTVRGDLVLRTKERTFRMPEHLAAGVYYVVVRHGDERKRKRMVYLR